MGITCLDLMISLSSSNEKSNSLLTECFHFIEIETDMMCTSCLYTSSVCLGYMTEFKFSLDALL